MCVCVCVCVCVWACVCVRVCARVRVVCVFVCVYSRISVSLFESLCCSAVFQNVCNLCMWLLFVRMNVARLVFRCGFYSSV